jgi:hypothetical protein
MTTNVVVKTTETAASTHLSSVGGLFCLAVLSSCLGRGAMQDASIYGIDLSRPPLPHVVRSFLAVRYLSNLFRYQEFRRQSVLVKS